MIFLSYNAVTILYIHTVYVAGILLESTRNEKQNRQQYCKLVRGSAVLLVNRLHIFIADQTERVRQA